MLRFHLLEFLVLSEKLFDLLIISLNNVISLPQKGFLDLIKLLMVINSHIQELLAHGFDEIIDIIILLLECFDVFFVLFTELLNEILDEFGLLLDDLPASLFLYVNVL